MITSPVEGPVSDISTDPNAFTVGGVPFTTFTDEQWKLVLAAWSGGRTLKVSFSEVTTEVTKIENGAD